MRLRHRRRAGRSHNAGYALCMLQKVHFPIETCIGRSGVRFPFTFIRNHSPLLCVIVKQLRVPTLLKRAVRILIDALINTILM